MGRRHKRKKVVEDVVMTGLADKGKAVGRAPSGEVLFVDGAVPGDVVDVLVLRKKKSFGQGIVKEFKSYSDVRVEPFCQHFDDCGGCKWQHLSYDAQTKHKHTMVVDAMRKIAKIPTENISPIKGCEETRYYRNKVEYSFSNKRWITEAEAASGEDIMQHPAFGFHRAGAWDKIIDIHTCHLQDTLSDKIRNAIRDYTMENKITYYDPRSHKGMMRNMIVRNTTLGHWMVIVSFGEPEMEIAEGVMTFLKESFSQITSLHYVINQKLNDTILDQDIILYKGDPFIIEQLGDCKYNIGPKSFFQTNSKQAKVLYDVVKDYAQLESEMNVYDLYTGLGSIALYLAKDCKQIVGIEEVEPAIVDARINAALNETENSIFYAGDVKDILTEAFRDTHGSPDVVITDPPRAGMHGEVINTLLTLAAPRIVYVSCNPGTQARDIALLSEKYDMVKMQPVDMFPHTHHIENVALLELKKT